MKRLSITFEAFPDSNEKCERECCDENGPVTHRWKWRGGFPPEDTRWLKVCMNCHLDLLLCEADDVRMELERTVAPSRN